MRTYAAMIDQFEAVARQNSVTHIENGLGNSDLDEKLKQWRLLVADDASLLD